MITAGKPEVFVDLCTQREYLADDGMTRCANAERIAPNLKHLIAYARWAKNPVISCVDSCLPNHVNDGTNLPCLNGPPEQKKARFGLLPQRIVIESDNRLCVPLDVLKHYQQVIFVKYHRDPFTNPKLDRLLTEMPAKRFVVFGIPLETSLRILVLGLLRRRRKVVLVKDACGYFKPDEAAMALRHLDVKGCELMLTAHFIAAAVRRRKRSLRARFRRRRSVA